VVFRVVLASVPVWLQCVHGCGPWCEVGSTRAVVRVDKHTDRYFVYGLQ
jgi:hypothetical protein